MLRTATSIASLALCCACGAAPSGATDRPNVLLIVLDTTRPDHLSTHGAERPTTPNLELLAQHSVIYRHAHSVAPWTLPSHMSMFTGLYPGEHTANWSALDAIEGEAPGRLGRTPFTFLEGERLLARRMKSAGYTTLAISSNPWVSSDSGFAEGFDWFADTWTPIDDRRAWYSQFDASLKTTRSVDMGRAGRNLLEFKRYFATHEVREPFFAFFNFVDPHFPYRPPAEFQFHFGGTRKAAKDVLPGAPPNLERMLLAGAALVDIDELVPFYDSELFYTDLVLGKLFEWLAETGRDGNTMIVITSDHGEHLGEQGRFSHQLSVEDELLSVPLIVRYADRREAGTVEEHPLVSNIDVYETILAAAGALPQDFSRPHRSLDLASMPAFDREFLLAENYFSETHLSQLQADFPAFPIESHRVVRRAVFSPEHKYLFEDLRSLSSTGPEIHAWLRRYADETRDLNLIQFGPPSETAERLESLKALGYLDDE
ncbi:MAG: arylsulfatase A-like enzyme [Chlamydiales bacterium]|jgi:arylsulfatase A-like enzyme